MRQSVLVTGASGFVGKCVVATLHDSGLHVVPVSRRAVAIGDLPVWTLGDDAGAVLRRLLRDEAITDVVHLAGRINGSDDDLEVANTGFTRLMLDSIDASGLKVNFYYLSSVSAIGPAGAYGRQKRACEDMILAAPLTRVVGLRSSLLYGPGDDKNVATLIHAVRRWPAIPVLGMSHVKLQPLYVQDLAKAFGSLLEGRGRNGNMYVIAGPRQEYLADMIRILQQRVKRTVPLMPVPLAPLRVVVGLIDRVFPFLKLPSQQIRALHSHRPYDSSDVKSDLGVSLTRFEDGVAAFVPPP